MARLQINDQFGGGGLQTHARPVAVTASVGQADTSQWKALAGVFAQGELLMETQRQLKNDADTERATQYANSMTVGELGEQIKGGTMLASESPVFAAKVQNIWGQNSHDALARDLTTKVTTGELSFKSPAEMDSYLTEARNKALEGADAYAIAGFDKGYAGVRLKLMADVAQTNDKAVVAQSINQASDRLGNKLLEVTSPEAAGTPQEAAAAILAEYHSLRLTQVIPDAGAKSALAEVVARAAGGGKPELLDALLDSDLPGVGSLRSFLGETKAQTLIAHAATKYDQQQRERIDKEMLPFMVASDTGELDTAKFKGYYEDTANSKYVHGTTIHSIELRNMTALANQERELGRVRMHTMSADSVARAQQAVDAQLDAGTLYKVQGTQNPKILTDTGKEAEFNVQAHAVQSLQRSSASLPWRAAVQKWAMNNVVNPDWQNQLQAGVYNLSSIGMDAAGKPRGELNAEGKKAIDLFRSLDSVSPESARTHAKGAYDRFSDISFLMAQGLDASGAASGTANSAAGVIPGSAGDKLSKSVDALVADMVKGPWWKPDFYARLMGDNTHANSAQAMGIVGRHAKLLLHSGHYNNAEDALKAAGDYNSSEAVSTKIEARRDK